jgi:hypothetical protein
MASQSVTIALEGTPTVAEFVVAVGNWQKLLDAIARDEGVSIQWVVEALDTSSAVVTARGETNDLPALERATVAYLDVAREVATGRTPAQYASEVRGLISILNGRVHSLKFETADGDITIAQRGAEPVEVATPAAYGAVEGRVQTLIGRGRLRFVLYDRLFDKAVSCYLTPGQEDIMRNAWGRIATVEGLVTRDANTGRPLTVRQVTRVTPRDDIPSNSWRRARGTLTGLGDEPAEATIRRLRDTQ